MSPFQIGVLVGLVVGVPFGMLAMSLCVMAGRRG